MQQQDALLDQLGREFGLFNRPAGVGCVPRGLSFTLKERPGAGQAHHDHARHGILVAERALTAAEVKAFELVPLVGAQALPVVAGLAAQEMREFASQYVAMRKEDADLFAAGVSDALLRALPGIRISICDMALLMELVAQDLAGTGLLDDAAEPAQEAQEAQESPNPERKEAVVAKEDWFHGVEHLTKDSTGYVYWRGKHVEHFSHRDFEEEAKEAKNLASRCLALESAGLEPSSRTTVYAKEFLALAGLADPRGKQWAQTILSHGHYAFMEGQAGRAALVFWSVPKRPDAEGEAQPDAKPSTSDAVLCALVSEPGKESILMTPDFGVACDGIGMDVFYELQRGGFSVRHQTEDAQAWIDWVHAAGLSAEQFTQARQQADEAYGQYMVDHPPAVGERVAQRA